MTPAGGHCVWPRQSDRHRPLFCDFPMHSEVAVEPPGPTAEIPPPQRYGADSPNITAGDMVETAAEAYRLFRRTVPSCGDRRIHGGHQVLTWATRYPDRVSGVIALATSARLTTQALAFDIVAEMLSEGMRTSKEANIWIVHSAGRRWLSHECWDTLPTFLPSLCTRSSKQTASDSANWKRNSKRNSASAPICLSRR